MTAEPTTGAETLEHVTEASMRLDGIGWIKISWETPVTRDHADAALLAALANRPPSSEEKLREALKPFADCVEQIDPSESDEEWAKFRLLIGDYRRAAAALSDHPASNSKGAGE